MVKNLPVDAGDVTDAGLIPGSGRSPEEGNGNPFQYSCLGNPVDRGAWWATDHGVAKESDTTSSLNNNHLERPSTSLVLEGLYSVSSVYLLLRPQSLPPSEHRAWNETFW